VILGPFCGVGWAEALRSLGLAEAGIDTDPWVCATRMAAGHRLTVRADAATFPLGHLAGRVAGLVASPPCQAFSRAGKRLGIRDLPALYEHVARVAQAGRWLPYPAGGWRDPRSPLVLEPLRYALDCRPEWVALEQVEDVAPLWRSFAHVLGRAGYVTWTGILCAADYGVPQTRYRAILMAHRDRPRVGPPAPTHHEHGGADLLGREVPRWVSMAEALGWGWEGPARTDQPSRTVDQASRQWVVQTGQSTEHGGGRPVDRALVPQPPAPAVLGGSAGHWQLKTGTHDRGYDRSRPRPLSERVTHRDRGGGLAQWAWERPATTVQGKALVPRPGHRDRAGGEHQQDGAVRITLDELAILQGMPSGYPWRGNRTQVASQIGNLVPPPLAAAIVAALTDPAEAAA